MSGHGLTLPRCQAVLTMFVVQISTQLPSTSNAVVYNDMLLIVHPVAPAQGSPHYVVVVTEEQIKVQSILLDLALRKICFVI